MGYLANKKHQAFIKTSLKFFMYFSFVITGISFLKNDYCSLLAEFRGQLYLLLSLAFIYSLCKKFYLASFVFLLLSIVNFFGVSSTNDFFSATKNTPATRLLFGSNQTSISAVLEQISRHKPDIAAVTNSYLENFDIENIIPENYTFSGSRDNLQNFIITRLPVKQSGQIHLGGNDAASFVSVENNENLTTYIAVDFSGHSQAQINSMLKKISAFITKQDNPVIVFGNFNTVSWSYTLSNFIAENNLSVKNAFFDNLRNLILPPHHYILGYNEGNFSGNIIMPYLNSFSKFTRF